MKPSKRFSTVVRYDLPASIVVLLVAVPLSLGIAVASGAPVMAGLIAAVIGGVLAGLVGGSPLQVSGPAAGLTVVVAELVNNFGWKVTCAITVLAGVLQVMFALSRIARIALAISPVVVHAMLAGIGITIALQQIHVLLGGSSASSAVENIKELPGQLTVTHLASAFLGLVVILTLLGWKYLPAKIRFIPGPLVAVVGATLLSTLLELDVQRLQLDGSLFEAIALPELPDGKWMPFFAGALTVALIASVESMLSAVAVDKLHTGPRTNFDRELLGQGAANCVSGFLGGLPVTGVVVRSATNVSAGARTRASAVLHGIWILLFSVFLAGLIQQIPKAVLAGLLIFVGIQLIKLADIKLARRTGDLWVYGITVLGVVLLNLLEGVLIGLLVAIGLVLWRVVKAKIDVEQSDSESWRVVLEGSFTFLALPKLTAALGSLPAASAVSIDLTVDFLDHSVHEVIDNWIRQHEKTGGTVTLNQGRHAPMDLATQGPPQRKLLVEGEGTGLAPWRAWQRSVHTGDHHKTPRALRSVLAGVNEYHRKGARVLREHMVDLAAGQDPDTLFLTCSDSRIIPNIITSSGPGDLFTVRNVGNLIPTGGKDDATEAAFSFALNELGVSSVVVCGHSSCGAMGALLHDHEDSAEAGAISRWLGNAMPSKSAYLNGHVVGRAAAEAGFSRVDQLAMVNIAIQLQTLERHHLVGVALAEGRIKVTGLFFDIPTARVLQVSTSAITELDLPPENPASVSFAH
ncbi:MAG: SulP family inorganic anion transporter [Mycobacteriaceae bacterium]